MGFYPGMDIKIQKNNVFIITDEMGHYYPLYYKWGKQTHRT